MSSLLPHPSHTPASRLMWDDEAVCYLCLDGGVDEAGQPLRRDCACRGTDAGFVHLACLTKYAAAKNKQAYDMNEFTKPWLYCPSCNQVYQNELGIDIATEFVSFVRRQYPDDTRMQVEALYVKLYTLNSMLDRLQPMQKREAGVTANVLLFLIDRMKEHAPRLHRRYSQIEAFAYGAHGHIALEEETEEGARRAVVYFERKMESSKEIGEDEGVANAKSNIAIAKSKYHDGRNIKKEVAKASQELYKLRVSKYGEESEYAILAGKDYAAALQNANCSYEARELSTKFLATSKQVLGPNHSTTRAVEHTLMQIIVITFIKSSSSVFV